MQKRSYAHIAVSFLLACLIVFFFKQDQVLRHYENAIPIFGKLRKVFFIQLDLDRWYERFLLSYLSDILWAYALYWASILVAKERQRAFVLAGVVCLLNEFFQLIPWIDATFDWYDIFFEFLTLRIADVIYSCVKANYYTYAYLLPSASTETEPNRGSTIPCDKPPNNE